MKTIQLKSVVILIAVFAVMSSFVSMPGAHSYRVYLDDKLLVEQYVNTKTIAPKVIIDPAENHKQLMVKYSECGRTVSGRVITIKDNNDKVLKEWRFEGTTSGFKDGMTCSVKDLVSLKEKSLKLYYASTDFPEGQQVATLVIGPGTNTASN